MENRDLITGYTEAAKDELQVVIDRYCFARKNQCNFNLKGVVPDEFIIDVALYLKSRMAKLGYKIEIKNSLLVVRWR